MLKPRGLALAKEVDFFTARCPECDADIPAASIAKAGTVLAIQELATGAHVFGGLPSGDPTCRCGSETCMIRLKNVTREEHLAVQRELA